MHVSVRTYVCMYERDVRDSMSEIHNYIYGRHFGFPLVCCCCFLNRLIHLDILKLVYQRRNTTDFQTYSVGFVIPRLFSVLEHHRLCFCFVSENSVLFCISCVRPILSPPGPTRQENELLFTTLVLLEEMSSYI